MRHGDLWKAGQRYMRRPPYERGVCKHFNCSNPTKGRLHYCSQECHDDQDVRCGALVRIHVGERDGGVCSVCGCDTRKLVRVARHLRRIQLELAGSERYGEDRDERHVPDWLKSADPRRPLMHGWRQRRERWDRELLQLVGFRQVDQSLWEADHVQPVVERPEKEPPCGLEGYRTLCQPCHRGETGELRQRMARRRRCQHCGRPKKKSRLTKRPCMCREMEVSA